MALANYTDLQSEVLDWTARTSDTNLSAKIPTFIQLAEAQISLEPAIRNAVVDTPLSSVVGSRNLTLPADFMEPRELNLNAFGVVTPMTLMPVENMDYQQVNGIPQRWAVNGSNIDLNYPADAVYSFTLRYKADLNLANTSTNWLMTNHPEVYLYATLVQAFLYEGDDQAVAKWQGAYQTAFAGVTWAETRALGLAPLIVDDMLISPGGFNIRSGINT